MSSFLSFQELITALHAYWGHQGCIVLQPMDMEVGAGTFHPASFLRAIGPEPWKVAYVQPSRRPSDGRYGDNPNRVQQHYQFQVILKPAPANIQNLYLNSLQAIGIDSLKEDIRFVEDNWESPTLGAWGLGWEVWLNGMEVTQFTYFQQVGGLACEPVAGEITYGLERLAMVLQSVEDVYHLIWSSSSAQEGRAKAITYRDVCYQFEVESSIYNFEQANVSYLLQQFQWLEEEGKHLIQQDLPLPAYEIILKASHTFNLLEARGAISVTERQHYILRIRRLAISVAACYYQKRKTLGFPLLMNLK